MMSSVNRSGPPRAVSSELEFKNYLQKKNSMGYFQNRYFITRGSQLMYWKDHIAHENNDEASASFDIKDISNMEKNTGQRIIALKFSSDKFTIEVKAPSDESLNLFYEILHCKRQLYCVSELLFELDKGTTLRTQTFAVLLVR